MLSPKKRRELKAQAHNLAVTVQLGAKGLSEAVLAEAETTIAHHELIKLKLTGADREQRQLLAEEIASKLKAETIALIGQVLVLYRKAPPKPPAKPARPSSRSPEKSSRPRR